MSTTYQLHEIDDKFELLAANPQTLARFACFCAKEYSTENLLAVLLLQYIDCRATAGYDVGNEYGVLHDDFLVEGSALAVNIGSKVRKVISLQTFNQPEREFRLALHTALIDNLKDTWSRYSLSNKPNPDAHYPQGFRRPRAIPSKDIMTAYLTARRIAGKGPHPARQK